MEALYAAGESGMTRTEIAAALTSMEYRSTIRDRLDARGPRIWCAHHCECHGERVVLTGDAGVCYRCA
ncbi:MAG: hypothetical protein ACLRM9_04635 [Collinsella aerofaciens]